MTGKNRSGIVKRIIDVCMTVALLLLMVYQVTGEVLQAYQAIILLVLSALMRFLAAGA